ncbi:MAG: DUF502 domain-containing protein [Pirellulales bacterium]
MPPVNPRLRRRQSWSYPFRRAVLRGLGVVLPPLLTIVIFLWVLGTIQQYALEPVTLGTRNVIAWYWNKQDQRKLDGAPTKVGEAPSEIELAGGEVYVRLGNGIYIPREVLSTLRNDPSAVLRTGDRSEIYRRYAEVVYLQPQRVVPLFVCVFILLLYLLGKFMAAGIGGMFWNLFERGIHRLPLVRIVYGSVKQVTDFMFNEKEIEYKRVVAVEYPRKGTWSLGFVTGESLLDIRSATNEPMLSLMIPASPMSITGYIVTVPKSETIDLDLTIDQALQFVISCGVVVPPHQIPRTLETAS